MTEAGSSPRDIAIIGMTGRFPGARDVGAFWRNLRDGVESVTFLTDEELAAAGQQSDASGDGRIVNAAAVLEDVESFDASFFGFSPKEAEGMDPQQRLFLEAAWSVLESAGYDPQTYPGPIGIYAGSGLNTYLLNNVLGGRSFLPLMSDLQTLIGSDKDFLTTRVSYQLGLTGPSVAVQTTCSTSLVAVSKACESLLDWSCDMALAGGVTVRVPQRRGYAYQPEAIFSPDGHCRPFDARAQGTLIGSGLGIVLLKRLEDALADGDEIHAVIKGAAVNNDGSAKVGYTAPSVKGQAEVIALAQAVAGVRADTIGYVEAHGTGTPLGDPIEVAALTRAFRAHTDAKGFCVLGAVKSNFGHLDTAAGIAGLIKTVLALKNRTIPPTLHFERPNPKLDLPESPFRVSATALAWEPGSAPRRAGVSSFGIGGTNAHVIVEEAPARRTSTASRPFRLLTLSARTEPALDTMTENLAAHFRRRPDLDPEDAAYTLQVGRCAFGHRRAVVCETLADAAHALESGDARRVTTGAAEATEPSVAFLFPGQGAQHVGMGRDLYATERVFREHVDSCSELLAPHLGRDLRAALYPAPGDEEAAARDLEETRITQPALFVVEHALAQLWISWGVRPQVLIGHSVGEYVAACLAGVFDLADGLRLVAARGRLMQEMPPGTMLAVAAPAPDVEALLAEDLALAAANGPAACVLSGPDAAIARAERVLEERGLAHRRLHTSHAFHSAMMDPLLPAFREELGSTPLKPPAIPFVSNRTGTWITATEATDPEYWVRHLRHTVRFADGARTLLQDPSRVLLEVGPGTTLSALTAACAQESGGGRMIFSSLRHPRDSRSDAAAVLDALGRLWVSGVRVDWNGFHAGERRNRVRLPTYPFERRRHWIDPAPASAGKTESTAAAPRGVADRLSVPSWKRVADPEPFEAAGAEPRAGAHWLVFRDEHGLGASAAARLRELSGTVTVVTPGTGFAREGPDAYTLRPERAEDYEALIEAMETGDALPDRIVHLWGVDPAPSCLDKTNGREPLVPAAEIARAQALGFHSVASLARAWVRGAGERPVDVTVVTSGVQDVTGDESLAPERATVLGACRVLPQEHPHVTCRSVDVVLPPTAEGRAALADRLLAESAAGLPDPFVAYRGTHRWLPFDEPVRPRAGRDRAPALRDRGVYLITGGLGGIGLVLAGFLARTARARLVLVGRRTVPPADARIRDLESAGAEVLACAADVSDPESMQAVLEQARERFGTVHGVIHCAGIPGRQLLENATPTSAEEVFAAKVTGTCVLDALCDGANLDFLVLCSSLASFRGAVAHSAYCGASAFLDAYARRRGSRAGTRTVAIDWDVWAETGMARNAAAPAGSGLHAGLARGLRSEEGAEAFRLVLGMDESQVLVSAAAAPVPAAPGAGSPEEATNGAAPRNPIERSVAAAWKRLLGVPQLGIHEDFFAIGGNSLVATQLLNRLRQEFGEADLSLRTLLDHPTVAGIAEAIAGALPPGAATDAPPAPPATDAPRDPVEETVAECWRQLLGVAELGIHDDFFAIGGNSLVATQLLNRLRQRFDRADLSLRTLLDNPTVAGLAAAIAGAPGDGDGATTPVALPERILDADPGERTELLRGYLRREVAEALDVAVDRVPEDGELDRADETRITSHLIWVVKRDLRMPLYPPEIRERLSVGPLAAYLADELERQRAIERGDWSRFLRAGDDGAKDEDETAAPAAEAAAEPKAGPAAIAAPAAKNPPMVFVLCTPRSGSTLLRIMLSGHSGLFCPPELTLLGHADARAWSRDRFFYLHRDGLARAFAAARNLSAPEGEALVDSLVEDNVPIREVYRRLQQDVAPRLLVDKTPAYALSPRTLAAAEEMFDAPRHVVLVRHPYAVIDSFVRNRFDRLRKLEGDPWRIAERHWTRANANLLRFAEGIGGERCRLVRYEELVSRPESVLRDLCGFLGIPFEDAVLRPYEEGKLFAGPGDPNLFERRAIDARLGEAWREVRLPRPPAVETVALAETLGYELPSA